MLINKKRKEFYQINLDVLKELINTYDKISLYFFLLLVLLVFLVLLYLIIYRKQRYIVFRVTHFHHSLMRS